mgnify:CR=1 FL=1
METSDWIIISRVDHCQWEGAAINGVRLIVFIEIGVKQVNFWISLCDPNAFIMLMPVSEDTDLFLSIWTTKG